MARFCGLACLIAVEDKIFLLNISVRYLVLSLVLIFIAEQVVRT
jgi:hypothetical protein